MPYHFSQRSLTALTGVHPTLVAIAHRALELTEIDFTVIEGVRTLERQRELYRQGKTKVIESGKHLPKADGYGHAIDVYPYINGKLRGAEPRPTPEERRIATEGWKQIAAAFKVAAAEAGAKITWGGDWSGAWDMPHFQLDSTASTKAAD